MAKKWSMKWILGCLAASQTRHPLTRSQADGCVTALRRYLEDWSCDKPSIRKEN